MANETTRHELHLQVGENGDVNMYLSYHVKTAVGTVEMPAKPIEAEQRTAAEEELVAAFLACAQLRADARVKAAAESMSEAEAMEALTP